MHKKRVPYSSAAESTMKNTTIHFIHHIISFPLHTTNTGRERERESEGQTGEGRAGRGEKEKDKEESV